LKRFHYVVANPMWNQDNYDEEFYDNDTWERFGHGTPTASSADWGWAQHMLASLNDKGRAAIVLDTGAVSRGSGSKSSNKERDIRKAFVEADFIDGVILLPENLFYNTTAPGIIMLLNRAKPADRMGQILLINASAYFVKEKEAQERADGRRYSRRCRGLPTLGDPREAESRDYSRRSPRSGLQPKPIAVC
jgi:type I restriction enzyme M protein